MVKGAAGSLLHLPLSDLRHLVGCALQVCDQAHCLRLCRDVQPSLLARDGVEAGLENARLLAASPELGLDCPILPGYEGVDLLLAVGHEPQRHRLHPARGERLGASVVVHHLLPQHGAELVAHQPVQDAPRLLRVDQILVDVPGVVEGLMDRLLRDLVEHHALHGLAAKARGVHKVPSYGLTFAVGVGGQVDVGGAFRLLAYLLHNLLLVLEHLVLGLKVAVHVHAQLARGQVAHVAQRRKHGVVAAKIAAYGARLCG